MDDIVFIGGQHIDVDCLAYGRAVGKRAADSELQLTAALPECKAVIEAVEAHLQVVDAAFAGEYVEVLDRAAVGVAEHDLAVGHTLQLTRSMRNRSRLVRIGITKLPE